MFVYLFAEKFDFNILESKVTENSICVLFTEFMSSNHLEMLHKNPCDMLPLFAVTVEMGIINIILLI